MPTPDPKVLPKLDNTQKLKCSQCILVVTCRAEVKPHQLSESAQRPPVLDLVESRNLRLRSSFSRFSLFSKASCSRSSRRA